MTEEVIDKLVKARENLLSLYEDSKKLASRAETNGLYYLKNALKNTIQKYIENYHNNNQKKSTRSYNNTLFIELTIPKKRGKRASKTIQLAIFYNERCDTNNNPIYFLKSESGKNIPILINLEKLARYNAFSDINAVKDNASGNPNYIFKITENKLRVLASKAYMGMLKRDNYLFDDELIDLLKEVYVIVEGERAELNQILTIAKENAKSIYNEIYDKVTEKYISEDKFYCTVTIPKEQLKSGTDHYNQIVALKKAILIDKYDEIIFLKHKIDSSEYEYIPVYTPELKKLLANDCAAGFNKIVDSVNEMRIEFIRIRLGEFADSQIKMRVKKPVERNNGKEER